MEKTKEATIKLKNIKIIHSLAQFVQYQLRMLWRKFSLNWKTIAYNKSKKVLGEGMKFVCSIKETMLGFIWGEVGS